VPDHSLRALVPAVLRLPLDFDAEAMSADVRDLPEQVWIPHFNKAIHAGDWSGVALRSIGGDPTLIYPDPTGKLEFADTWLLAACPAIGRALSVLRCPVTTVRLLALGTGSEIREHHDDRLGYGDGEVRLHIPVVTAPGVEFSLSGQPIHMDQGECWYLDLRLPHRAINHSAVRRVHLAVDCRVNPWLEGVFRAAVDQLEASPTMGKAGGDDSPANGLASPKANTAPLAPSSQ
jgi:hypothetical protein